MQTAAIAELKASLSEYLGKVKSGEDILITDRGVPVAKIVPLRRDAAIGPNLLALERAGTVRIGSGAIPPVFFDQPRPADPGAAARSALAEERESGR